MPQPLQEDSLTVSYKAQHGFTARSSNCASSYLFQIDLKTYIHTKTSM